MYLLTKFQRDISIHGWDKSASGFGWQSAAILEFYFRFQFWPMCNYPHVGEINVKVYILGERVGE